MVISCCIKGCTSEKYPGCDLNFYSFPTDEKIKKKWMKLTNVTANIRCKRICSLHFSSTDFIKKGGRKQLGQDAVPTNIVPPFNRTYNSNMIIISDKMDVNSYNNYTEVNEKHIDNSVDDEYDDYKPGSEDDDLRDVFTENIQNSAALINISRCKCCLENDKLKSVWQEYYCDGDREVYGTMLVECFALSWVKPKDPLSSPDRICESCIVRLKDALSFKTEVLASEQILNVEVDSVDCDKLKQECDEVEEIETEYLNLDDLDDDDDNRSDVNDKYHSDVDKDVIDSQEIMKNNVITVKLEKLSAPEPSQEETKDTSKRKREVPKKFKEYTADDLQKAVDAVVNKHMSQNSAAKRYEVPLRVLGSAVKNHVPIKKQSIEDKSSRNGVFKTKKNQLYPLQNLAKAVDDVWNKRLTQTEASKHYKVPRSTIIGVLIKKYGRSSNPEPGEKQTPFQTTKKNPVQGVVEMAKHTANILAIMEHSNATPIRSHGDGGYLCCFCDQQYPKPEDLKAHTLEHDMKTKRTFTVGKRPSSYFVKLDISHLKCTICKSSIRSLESLLTHFDEEHGLSVYMDIKNHILPFRFETDELRCTICYNVFNNFKVLQTHLNVHYPNYVCSVCNAGFVSSMILHSHSRGHLTGVFKCEQCSKVYTTQRQLRSHENLVHKQAYMASKCGYCYEKFKSYHRKMEHLIKVHNVKPMSVPCNACDKTFKSQSSLRIHKKRDHLMERKYACTECDKKFFARVMLDAHMLKHTDVRNFQCDVCNKSYKRRHTLREHMRIHANDRRFKCVHCGAAFVQKCSWRAHMRTKHDVIS